MRDRFLARRDGFWEMRRQTRKIVLLMALIEALRHGPAQLVFAGKDGYPAMGEEDYGIAYWVGYFISWIYMCVFMVVFVPLFSVSPFRLSNATSTMQPCLNLPS